MRTIKKGWNAKDIGDLHGKTVIVTGANSGIGFETALALGRAGAQVIVACRDPKRGEEALARLQEGSPGSAFRLEALDLASLASVRSFAARFEATGSALDILVNNAGVMALPKREVTVDGFERQFGTNHLGHFALTALLLPALRRSASPRVVTVSSGMAYIGRIQFDNLQSERRYSPMVGTYSQTKLANLLFMTELGRRAPWLTSVASHPGATRTNLQKHTGFETWIFMRLLAQDPPEGALPSLYAATDAVASGEFYGPRGLGGLTGSPKEARLPGRAHDKEVARRLWERSEELTGVRYHFDETIPHAA